MKERLDLVPAALYARVSSERQDVDLSVAAQLRALRDYAERNGYLVVREYVDEAESGRIADRPQFSRMLDEAGKQEAPFKEILVWKFSRFTRKREHAVAFKSMLRRRGIRVVSITEQADDTPTGKLLEAIIESVDEFYSENLAQEVSRGMREAASRGFWMTSYAPYGYKKVHVQDGAKTRPRLELNPPSDAVVRRIFEMVLHGKSILDITKALNAEGIPTTNGKKWLKTTINTMLANEAYTGTLVWGANAKDGTPPVRIENAFPAIVSQQEFRKVRRLLKSRAPNKVNPRRASSAYLLSGLLKCETCGKAMTAADAKSGRYTYYVCHSLLKKGRGTCDTPRLNSKSFEKLIIDQIRENVLTESNIRDLVKMLDEEMDGAAREQRERLETIEQELEDVKKRLGRIWQLLETTDIEMADASERIKEHRDRQQQLEIAAERARSMLAERRAVLDSADTIAAFAEEMSEFLKTSELTETRAFVNSFVKEVLVKPGRAAVVYYLPMPDDSPMGERDTAELALSGRVIASGRSGGPSVTILQTFEWVVNV
ncbi:MAG: recombinase family protein [Chloroflexi bacterium]|nr:recombinase family protein [Chloroflexota bacterium]